MRPIYSSLMLGTAVTIVLLPVAAMAQAAGGPSEALPYLAIAGIVWFAIDKIIDLLPMRESTLVAAVRAALNAAFAKKPQ